MSSGPKNVTSTTTEQPPEFITAALQNAVGGARFDFQQNRSDSGRRLIKDASDLTSQTIRGDFLRPESNPFLQGTFNRAADLTRGRLDTEFAGAGRNLGASFPARSDELQTLASNIFGGNFQAERDRQAASITDAQGLDPLNMFINRLAGVIPGAGGSTQSIQPVFKTGLF